MKNSDFAKDMLGIILKRMKLLPMKRSTDWVMEIIKERVDLNLEVFNQPELTIRLCRKNIEHLEKLPEERKNSDFNISLLREKFSLIIHLMLNPEEEYKEGGDEYNPRIATVSPQKINVNQ